MYNTHTSHGVSLHDSSSLPAQQTHLLTLLLCIYGKQTERRYSDLQKLIALFSGFCCVLNLEVEFSIGFSVSYQDLMVLGYIQGEDYCFFTNET